MTKTLKEIAKEKATIMIKMDNGIKINGTPRPDELVAYIKSDKYADDIQLLHREIRGKND